MDCKRNFKWPYICRVARRVQLTGVPFKLIIDKGWQTYLNLSKKTLKFTLFASLYTRNINIIFLKSPLLNILVKMWYANSVFNSHCTLAYTQGWIQDLSGGGALSAIEELF